MPVLLDSPFNTGDSEFASGPSHPRAKIVELIWNANGSDMDGYGFISLRVEVGDEDGYGRWMRGENSRRYDLRISGLDYYEVVTALSPDVNVSVYENVKILAYEWINDNTRFSGTLE